MKVSEVLTKARALIEKGWTQHSFARDRSDRGTLATASNACQFCALGAIRAIEGVESGTAATTFLRKQLPNGLVASFNDRSGRTQEDVLALFGRAIAAAQKEEA